MTAWARQSVKEFYAKAKPNKYRAIPTWVDGIRFASGKEAARYGVLKILQRTGEIRDLKWQQTYKLSLAGIHLTRYRADFTYYDKAGKVRVEDTKGMRKGVAYDLFRLKAKLMLAINGILVEEV